MGYGEPFFVLKSFSNELRLYEDHLEGEFFGKELIETFGNCFYSLKYSEVESVLITETPDKQVKILEINFDGKPEFGKKHLHPSNLFFRKSRKEDIRKCLSVKALIEHLMGNPFDPEKALEVLFPGKERGIHPDSKQNPKFIDKIRLFFQIL